MKGSKVFQFAPIETEKIAYEVNNTFIQNNLAQIDWIIFPDVFAVDYFVELLEANEFDLFGESVNWSYPNIKTLQMTGSSAFEKIIILFFKMSN